MLTLLVQKDNVDLTRSKKTNNVDLTRSKKKVDITQTNDSIDPTHFKVLLIIG